MIEKRAVYNRAILLILLCLYVQLLYAGEGEARRPGDDTLPALDASSQPGTANVKGHELVQISYHMPTTCEVCPRPLGHMFRPPPALECRRCRIKLHKVVNVCMGFSLFSLLSGKFINIEAC